MWLPEGKGKGRDRLGVWDDMYTLLYLKITNKDLLLRSSLDGKGVWGRTDTGICVAESLHCPPETITTLLIGYI